MFEPGVLPEEFSQTRERRTLKPLAQEETQEMTVLYSLGYLYPLADSDEKHHRKED